MAKLISKQEERVMAIMKCHWWYGKRWIDEGLAEKIDEAILDVLQDEWRKNIFKIRLIKGAIFETIARGFNLVYIFGNKEYKCHWDTKKLLKHKKNMTEYIFKRALWNTKLYDFMYEKEE